MFVSADNYAGQHQVEDAYAGAAHIEAVDGGWMVFATIGDYQVWSRQV